MREEEAARLMETSGGWYTCTRQSAAAVPQRHTALPYLQPPPVPRQQARPRTCCLAGDMPISKRRYQHLCWFHGSDNKRERVLIRLDTHVHIHKRTDAHKHTHTHGYECNHTYRIEHTIQTMKATKAKREQRG